MIQRVFLSERHSDTFAYDLIRAFNFLKRFGGAAIDPAREKSYFTVVSCLSRLRTRLQ